MKTEMPELGTMLFLVAANKQGDIMDSAKIRATTAKGAAQQYLHLHHMTDASFFIGTNAAPRITRFEANNGVTMFVENLGEQQWK